MPGRQGLVSSLDRNSLSVPRERFGFIGRHIVGTEVPPGTLTKYPSVLTEADELLARKERYVRCFALAAHAFLHDSSGTAYPPAGRSPTVSLWRLSPTPNRIVNMTFYGCACRAVGPTPECLST